MNKQSKIFVAGHRGLVGSAIVNNLIKKGYTNIITKTHKELDLTNQMETASFFAKEKPDYVFLAAAKVGGIIANNTYRADFIYNNMMIQNNVIHQSYVNKVKKMLFLGSTCIYPKNAVQPIKEDSLLTDVLEYTNEPYAIAKIAGIKMCESYNLQYGTNFISVMPTNLYGPNDNFDLEKSHVLPALIKKIHLAKLLEEGNKEAVLKALNVENFDEAEVILSRFGISSTHVEIWGSGKPKREFLWSEDMADACVHIMECVDFKDLIKNKEEVKNTHINIGTGEDISIKELTGIIKKEIDFKGDFVFNTEKPDGTMRKVTDVSKLDSLNWKYSVDIEEGIAKMYDWYKKSVVVKPNKTILTYGTFDLLHYGHIEILKRASDLGKRLIVGLSTDEFNKIKGKKCRIPYAKRKEFLESLEFVDLVIPESNWEQKIADVQNTNADVFVMGDDWAGEFDFLNNYCEVVYLPRTAGISTTKLKSIIDKNDKSFS